MLYRPGFLNRGRLGVCGEKKVDKMIRLGVIGSFVAAIVATVGILFVFPFHALRACD